MQDMGAPAGEERATLTGHTGWVLACAAQARPYQDDVSHRWRIHPAISPNSHFIVTPSRDRTCRIWDAATGGSARPSPGTPMESPLV